MMALVKPQNYVPHPSICRHQEHKSMDYHMSMIADFSAQAVPEGKNNRVIASNVPDDALAVARDEIKTTPGGGAKDRAWKSGAVSPKVADSGD